ncbi:hypothetical protein [Micromonospora carbonacea]|uniref:hypothetical protein n=1 Tax=Micromonospora carbonacea TaxID=47853 RepID=UPI003D72D44A
MAAHIAPPQPDDAPGGDDAESGDPTGGGATDADPAAGEPTAGDEPPAMLTEPFDIPWPAAGIIRAVRRRADASQPVYGLARPPETFYRNRSYRDAMRRRSRWEVRVAKLRHVPPPPRAVPPYG